MGAQYDTVYVYVDNRKLSGTNPPSLLATFCTMDQRQMYSYWPLPGENNCYPFSHKR